ncbi:MAG: PASTA domain-containing protein [Leifsonia sp.]|uniref:PASTA domain-containing protein n=1 Tax=Leifsonia sp. TaxID=1870902 RepID=UPI003F7D2639
MDGRVRARLLRAAAAAAMAVALPAAGAGTLGALSGCAAVAQGAAEPAPALLDVVGKPADQAGRILRAAGYRVAFVGEHGDPVSASPARLVVRQDPAGGTGLGRGRLVTLGLGAAG